MNAHPRSSILVAMTLVGCVASSPQTGSDERTSTLSASLLGGELDVGHAFDVGICAGPLVAPGLPNAGACRGNRCSGTLVAPNVVLTARHCIRGIAYAADFCSSTFTTSPLGPWPVQVTTSPTSASGSPKWYGVTTELVPAGDNLCNDDVALLVLGASVPADEATPAKVRLHRDVATHPPTEVAIVGRGNVAEAYDVTTFSPRIRVSGGFQRRVLEHVPFVCATNDASAPCTVVDYASPPTNSFAAPPAYFVIGASVAAGDSGSGVFDQAKFDKKRPGVIGVSAAATWGPDGTLNFGLISRLEAHAAFIQSALDTYAAGEDSFAEE